MKNLILFLVSLTAVSFSYSMDPVRKDNVIREFRLAGAKSLTKSQFEALAAEARLQGALKEHSEAKKVANAIVIPQSNKDKVKKRLF